MTNETERSGLSSLSRSIEGKVALVTGAASGMGRATARVLAAAGARVVATDLDGEGVARVAAEIVAAGGDAHGWELDVADAGRISAVVERVASELGGVDILINNAGVALGAPIDAGRIRDCLAARVRRNAHRASTPDSELSSSSRARRCRAHRQRRLHRGVGRFARHVAVHRRQARSGWFESQPGRRARRAWRDRQLHLSRAHSNRNDAADSRGRQGQVRATASPVASLRRSRGGGAGDPERGSAGVVVPQWRDHPGRWRAHGEGRLSPIWPLASAAAIVGE